jgi:hypothetical protein
MLRKDYESKGSELKKSLVVFFKGLGANTKWLAVNIQPYSNSDSVKNFSCEKWAAGSCGRGQYGNPEEGERLPLNPLLSNDFVCCSYSDLWNV